MRRAQDIPAAIINLRVSIAQSLGGDREAILFHSGLDEERLSKPTNRITVGETMKVWEAILEQTGSEDVGLLAGSRMRLASLGMLGYVMMNSPSIEKGYNKLCTYQRVVVSVAFINPIDHGDAISYELEMQEDWEPNYRFTVDFMVSSFSAMFKDNTPLAFNPIAVGFHFPKPKNIETYRQIFQGAELSFGCEKTFIKYSKKELSSRITGANSDLFQHFSKELDFVLAEHDNEMKYTRQVKDLIQQKLKAEIPSIDEVAKNLAVSTRSLQSHLKNENTTFQKLLNEVRKEVSIKQLKNGQFNITDVAFLTGFSDISVFSRSFKKWTGLTPSQYQMQFA